MRIFIVAFALALAWLVFGCVDDEPSQCFVKTKDGIVEVQCAPDGVWKEFQDQRFAPDGGDASPE